MDKPAPPPITLGSFVPLALKSPAPVTRGGGVKTCSQAKQAQSKTEDDDDVTIVKPFAAHKKAEIKELASYAAKVTEDAKTQRREMAEARARAAAATAPRAALATTAPVPSVPTTLSKPTLSVSIPLIGVQSGSMVPGKSHGTSAARAPGSSGSCPSFVVPKMDFQAGLTTAERTTLREAVDKRYSSTGLWATGSHTQDPGPEQTEPSAPALGPSKQIVENFEAEDQRRRALLGTCTDVGSQSFAFQYIMATSAQVRSVN